MIKGIYTIIFQNDGIELPVLTCLPEVIVKIKTIFYQNWEIPLISSLFVSKEIPPLQGLYIEELRQGLK